jgi:hypothetical protein
MDLGNAGLQLVYIQDVSKLSDVLLQMALPLLGWLPAQRDNRESGQHPPRWRRLS